MKTSSPILQFTFILEFTLYLTFHSLFKVILFFMLIYSYCKKRLFLTVAIEILKLLYFRLFIEIIVHRFRNYVNYNYNHES